MNMHVFQTIHISHLYIGYELLVCCTKLLMLTSSNSGLGGAEGPDRIFVGGLPYYFTEVQIRELLESFGYAT